VADPPPGEVAETDFGVLGHWLDPGTDRRRRVYGLLVTLCCSRYAFLAITLLFRLDWLAAQENVIFCGPVGVGKSWFAEALGYSACRASHCVARLVFGALLEDHSVAYAEHLG
jgi:hypothetical protein